MAKGQRKHSYNRVSLKRHDAHTKKEPWDYRNPQLRKKRPYIHVRKYWWDGHRWVPVEEEE